MIAEQLTANEWAVHQCVVCGAAAAVVAASSESSVDVDPSIATTSRSNGTTAVATASRPTRPSESPSVLVVIGAIVGAVVIVFLIFCCILAANRRKKHDKQAKVLAEAEARELNDRMEDYYKYKRNKKAKAKAKRNSKGKKEVQSETGRMSVGRTHEFEDAADESN